MGRFALRSRNKAPSALESAQPMSKAHKILGSTPINIDSPRLWDDGSSGFSASTAESTAPSYGGDEDGHHVTIARSEGEFVEDHDKLSALLGTTAYPTSAVERQGILRKTHSSGAMRTMYNRNGRANADVPSLPSHADALGIQSSTRNIPRPEVMMDEHYMARKGSLPHLRTDDLFSSSHQTKSPSFFTSFMSPAVGSPRQPRRSPSKKIQKRRVRDADVEPVMAPSLRRPSTAGTSTSKSGTVSSREAPDLYDHYEQMSFRHVLQEKVGDASSEVDSQTSESLVDDGSERREIQTALSPKIMKAEPAFLNSVRSPVMVNPSASKPPPASSKPKTKVATKASSSKNLLKSMNLQEQSMLMLSDSDSDDEDDITPPGPSRVPTAPMGQLPGMRPASPAKAPQLSRDLQSPISPISPRGGKRASFAPANTYITIPSSNVPSTKLNVDYDSDSEYSRYSSAQATIRASSMKSDGTFGPQSIQEQTIQEQTIQEDTVRNDFSDAAETHQNMTSPIGYAPANSVSRPARPVIDASNSRNSVHDSIRRFELMSPGSARNGHYSFDDDPHMTAEEDAEAEALIAEYDFDFPAPPSTRQSMAPRRQSQRYTLTESIGSDSRPSSQAQPLKSILKKASIISTTTECSDPTREEITVYLEEREPSPDLRDFLDPDGIIRSSIIRSSVISESSDRYILPAVSYDPKAPNSKQQHAPLLPSPSVRSASGRLPGNMATVHEVEESEAEVKGVPRPDSPISPSDGISTPTFGGKSRLSVVASKPFQTGLVYDASNVI